jgi:hypothetical protein
LGRTNLTIVLTFVAIFIILPAQVRADQPYYSGYESGSLTTASKVLFNVDFAGTTSSEIPSSKWLGGVLSVAGANNTSVTGYVYQSLIVLWNNDGVTWAPQAYYGGSQHHYYSRSVGSGYYVAFYGRIDIGSGNATYKMYAYPSKEAFNSDQPAIYTWSNATKSQNFVVGTQYYDGFLIKHLQFGVESNERVTETTWYESNSQISYYNGSSWRYNAAYSTFGNTSHITWTPDGLRWLVGGINYDGVNRDFTDANLVTWKYAGSTLSDGTQLWSQTGTVSDRVSRPYQ